MVKVDLTWFEARYFAIWDMNGYLPAACAGDHPLERDNTLVVVALNIWVVEPVSRFAGRPITPTDIATMINTKPFLPFGSRFISAESI